MNKVNIFDVNIYSLNLMSFMIGMCFSAFLSWYRRTAFAYIITYLVILVIYYAMIKPIMPTVGDVIIRRLHSVNVVECPLIYSQQHQFKQEMKK